MSSLRQDGSHRPSTVGGSEGPGFEADGGRARFLSIIVPSKNEAASLPGLLAEIAGAFRPKVSRASEGASLDGFEVIVVDDGSTDETPSALHRLMEDYPELRPIRLATNAGQSAATLAGFRSARGAWVAILDADLQNDPADLAKLWDALPGYDAGLGWRTKREDVWSKRVISKLANKARNAVLGESIRDTGCAVRIFPRSVALRFPMFHGAHRFYGPLLIREGCRIVQIPVGHRPRPHGKSHYNIWNRSVKVVADLLGVAWIMRRPVRYRIGPLLDESATPAPHATSVRRGVAADAEGRG